MQMALDADEGVADMGVAKSVAMVKWTSTKFDRSYIELKNND